MIEFVFVAIICMGEKNCDFVISNTPITKSHCQQVKRDFLNLPFRPEVTMAAAQCMNITTGEKI
mgnify:CR=1 FL=1